MTSCTRYFGGNSSRPTNRSSPPTMEDQDSPRAPLMAGSESRPDDIESYDARDGPSPRGPGNSADTSPGVFVLALTLAAGISGLLFGCKLPSAAQRTWLTCSWCRRHGRHIGNPRVHRHGALAPAPDIHGQVRHHVVDFALCPLRVAAVLDARRQARPQARHPLCRRPLYRGGSRPSSGLDGARHGRRPVHRRGGRRGGELRCAAVPGRGGAGRAPRPRHHHKRALHHPGPDGRLPRRLGLFHLRRRGDGLAVDSRPRRRAGRPAGGCRCIHARNAALARQGWPLDGRQVRRTENQRRRRGLGCDFRRRRQGNRGRGAPRRRGEAARRAPGTGPLEVARGVA